MAWAGACLSAPRQHLPPAGEWNDAVQHSNDFPSHILGPFEDVDGAMHMECLGDGDPNEPSNCDFATANGIGQD